MHVVEWNVTLHTRARMEGNGASIMEVSLYSDFITFFKGKSTKTVETHSIEVSWYVWNI